MHRTAYSGQRFFRLTPAPPAPVVIAPAPVSGSVVESRIDGEFQGWDGDTVFRLLNGQIWTQASYSYSYHDAYDPQVLIYPSNGGWRMRVDGVSQTISRSFGFADIKHN